METFHPSMPFPFPYTFPTAAEFMAASSAQNASTSASTWMDSRLWSRLPQRILDRVIAFLPPPAFFRARCVCKRWYGLFFSPNFLELSLHVSPRRHWFIFFKHKAHNSYIYRNIASDTATACDNIGNSSRTNCEGYLFDPQELSWYRISFALIPPGFYPASSSGGLVCWVSDEAGSKSLVLSNPLVGSLTPLPPTFRPRLFPTVGLNITASSIDVTVAGDDLISPYAVKNLTAENFHVDNSGYFSLWGTTSNLPRLCSLESGKMVFVGGKIYCMNFSPFSILTYNMASNSWHKIQAPMRRFLRCPSLMESCGKLILVAAVEKSKLNVPRSLRLWVLQASGTSWVEVERMPQQLYMQFAEEESGQGFDCVGHGEFVMVMIRGSSDKGLVFDMWRKSWQWIPPCPYTMMGSGDSAHNARGEGGDVHGFAYEPRLATPVTGILDQISLSLQHFNV